ncbi:type VI secretion system tube protein TssD [uncultured Algibacter sp.]|uniref:type VI secretion system tube protein TssD n=1 Tax=uncultured Algibacter sp. TaxID=298659 RepID=UPI0032180D68
MVKAKLLIDDLEINILQFSITFSQEADINGRPSNNPLLKGLRLLIETRKDFNLADWSFAQDQTKQLELNIYPAIIGGKTRKITLNDCYLVHWETNYSSTDNKPTSEVLEITCAGFKDSNSMGEYSSYWRKTFPRQEVKATTLNNQEEQTPKIIDFYTANKQGDRILKYNIGDTIYVNIKSENKIGDDVEINLKDKTKDFKYQGTILKNDSMNYQIRSNNDKIELEVVKQN